jgi:hypothetical protein
MIPSGVVTIVLNGSIVSGALSARLVAGRVVAPLSPIVVQLATRTAYEPASADVVIERDNRRIVVPVRFVDDAVPYVELAPIVRGLGGSVAFDARSKTLVIVLSGGEPIATPSPAPLDLNRTTAPTPSPAPLVIQPRPPGPSLPRPRRTAIPAAPSEPESAAPVPSTEPTSQRR